MIQKGEMIIPGIMYPRQTYKSNLEMDLRLAEIKRRASLSWWDTLMYDLPTETIRQKPMAARLYSCMFANPSLVFDKDHVETARIVVDLMFGRQKIRHSSIYGELPHPAMYTGKKQYISQQRY